MIFTDIKRAKINISRLNMKKLTVACKTKTLISLTYARTAITTTFITMTWRNRFFVICQARGT